MKIRLGPKDILFPIPAALIVSGDSKKPNIITVAWIGMVSITPPIVAISIHKSRYSYKLIKKYNDFSVNIPSASQFHEVDYCGIVSGSDRNKFTDTNLTPLGSDKINAPIIKECPFNLECKVIKKFKISEHTTIFGEIVETHIDKDKIGAECGTGIDISKVDPLIYCSTIGEYWSIGKKIGDSFKAGIKIKEKIIREK